MKMYIEQEDSEELKPINVKFTSILKAYVCCTILDFTFWALIGFIVGIFMGVE